MCKLDNSEINPISGYYAMETHLLVYYSDCSQKHGVKLQKAGRNRHVYCWRMDKLQYGHILEFYLAMEIVLPICSNVDECQRQKFLNKIAQHTHIRKHT